MCSSYTAISCSLHWKRSVDMKICRHNDHIEISELDPFLAELLRQIPASASPDGVSAAEQRLFSSPANGKETELCAEWMVYVEPVLLSICKSSTETEAADLVKLHVKEHRLANCNQPI